MTTFNRHIIVWFLLASAIMCSLGYIAYRSSARLDEQNQWVIHTYKVMMRLDQLIIHFKEGQTALRGYVITGEPRHHEMVMSTRDKVDEDFVELTRMVGDNQTQLRHIDNLKANSAKSLDFADKILAAYAESGMDAAIALVRTGIGQARIDKNQEIVDVMMQVEYDLLHQRQQAVEDASYVSLLIGAGGLFSCLLILSIVFWTIHRETHRRANTERSLQGLLTQMEAVNYERQQIAQMSDFLQSCRTQGETHELIRQNMPRLFPGSHGSLAIISNSRNQLDVALNWGDDQSIQAQFSPDDCWALRRGKLHIVTAGTTEPDCSHLITRMPESVCVPLLAHGETLGVLYIASADRGYFNERRMLLLRTIAEQVSLAMANMKLQHTLRMQTLKDPLTQLYNRRYMESSLEREILRARRNDQPLSVLMLDVDHFKRFNDTHGHDAGDQLLKEFARLLNRNVRGEDIACRYGGEEFIIILPTAPLEIAQARAEKIIEQTRNLHIRHNQEELGKLSVSIGISVYPHHADDVEMLIKSADRALYKAKHAGRDRFMVADSVIAS